MFILNWVGCSIAAILYAASGNFTVANIWCAAAVVIAAMMIAVSDILKAIQKLRKDQNASSN